MAECFRSALTMAQAESATTVWFEVRMGSSTFKSLTSAHVTSAGTAMSAWLTDGCEVEL
jgi:hypothetical protein